MRTYLLIALVHLLAAATGGGLAWLATRNLRRGAREEDRDG